MSSPAAKDMLSRSSVVVLLWLPCCAELITLNQSECGRSDADMTLLQMSKSSDYVEMSQEEFADGLKCAENQDSFFQTGGNFVWVWAGSPGVLWSDFMFSWAKGPNNKNYVGVDYTFLSKTYEIDDFHGIAVDFGVTNLPMTLWAQLTYSVNPLIPMKETGCPIFPRLDNGFYVLLPDLPFKPQSENFDSAGWPSHSTHMIRL